MYLNKCIYVLVHMYLFTCTHVFMYLYTCIYVLVHMFNIVSFQHYRCQTMIAFPCFGHFFTDIQSILRLPLPFFLL